MVDRATKPSALQQKCCPCTKRWWDRADEVHSSRGRFNVRNMCCCSNYHFCIQTQSLLTTKVAPFSPPLQSTFHTRCSSLLPVGAHLSIVWCVCARVCVCVCVCASSSIWCWLLAMVYFCFSSLLFSSDSSQCSGTFRLIGAILPSTLSLKCLDTRWSLSTDATLSWQSSARPAEERHRSCTKTAPTSHPSRMHCCTLEHIYSMVFIEAIIRTKFCFYTITPPIF